MPSSISAELLPWDSRFFGFPVALVEARPADDEALGQAISTLRSKGARLAYWQVDADDAASNRAAERNGGVLINMRAEYSCLVTADASGPASETMGSAVAESDRVRLHDLALQSGEQSRFRLDPAIPEERWATLYRLWMDESLAGAKAGAVLVRRRQGAIAGMITVAADGSQGEIGLFGVAAEARGQGVGSALLADAMRWFAANGCTTARVATQGENEAARAVYQRAGFGLQRLVNVFHFWI